MTTPSDFRNANGSLVTQAIRTAKGKMREAGKCDGRCLACLPEMLQKCMVLRDDIRREEDAMLAAPA